MIHEEICTYEVCKLAKEKGFNWVCPHYFRLNDKDLFMIFPSEDWSDIGERINAPTQSLLQRWLREEKKISVEVSWFDVGKKYFWVAKDMNNHDAFKPKTTKCMTFYDTWEQALEHGLKYALKELK